MRRIFLIALLLVVAGTCVVGIAPVASAAGHGHCIAEGQAPIIGGTTADRLLLGVLAAFAFVFIARGAVPDFVCTKDQARHRRWRKFFFRVWIPLPVLLASQAIDDPQTYASVTRAMSWHHA